MRARGAEVVGTVSHAKGGLGGNQSLIALAFERLTQDFLGKAAGVNVGGIEEVDSGFETDVEEATGFSHVGVAPGFEKLVAAPEGGDPITKCRDLEAGASKKAIFHVRLDAAALPTDAEEMVACSASQPIDDPSCWYTSPNKTDALDRRVKERLMIDSDLASKTYTP